MLLEIMPYVLGAMVSPVLLATTVVLLAQAKKPLSKTLVFLVGGVVTATVVGSVVFFAAHARTQTAKPSLSDSLIHIAVGLVLLVLAARIWRKPKKAARGGSKKVHYGRDFLLGVVLMASNFTSLIMFVPASLELQSASLETRLTGLAMLIAATTLAIWLPLLLVIIMGKSGQKLLAALSRFMAKYGQQVSGAMIGLIALYVLYKGISGL